MQKTTHTNHPSTKNHQSAQRSTTLNRKYVKRPTVVKITKTHSDLNRARRERLAEQINQERLATMRRGYLAATPAKTSTPTPSKIPIKSPSASKVSAPTPTKPPAKSSPSTSTPLKITPKSPSPAQPSPSTTPKSHTISQNTSSVNSNTLKEQKVNSNTMKINLFKSSTSQSTPQNTPPEHPLQTLARTKMTPQKAPSAAELKHSAIEQALKQASANTARSERHLKTSRSERHLKTSRPQKLRKEISFLRGRRALLALSCAAFVVAALGYFVHINFPDISARVAALQAGFNVSYPSYVPQNYQLSGISSNKSNHVIIRFSGPTHDFTISEEKSTWDSQALLNNFVKKEWKDNYTTSTKQGITVYLHGGSAAWVNGGILYKITSAGGLSKIQLHNIIYSL